MVIKHIEWSGTASAHYLACSVDAIGLALFAEFAQVALGSNPPARRRAERVSDAVGRVREADDLPGVVDARLH